MKKFMMIALVAIGFIVLATPESNAGVSIGIGFGFPGFYGYPAFICYYPYGYYPYGAAYYRPVVYYSSGYGPYYWWHGRRIYYSAPPLPLDSSQFCERGPIPCRIQAIRRSPNDTCHLCVYPVLLVGEIRVTARMRHPQFSHVIAPIGAKANGNSEKRRVVVVIVARQKVEISGDIGVLDFRRG